MNWLLLRGLSREKRQWASFPELLASRTNRSYVACLDLPGAGTENGRQSPTSVPEIMEDVRRRWLAERDAHPGPWGLAAQSLGGMVTLQWIATHPEDFARAVVVNTSAADLNPIRERMSLPVIAKVFGSMLTLDPVQRETNILAFTTALVSDPAPIARYFATLAAERPISRTNVLRQLVAGSRAKAPARIEVPLLVIAAAKDQLANPACGMAIAKHYGAPLELHPTAGHDLALDDPQWLADQIARWDAAARPPAA